MLKENNFIQYWQLLHKKLKIRFLSIILLILINSLLEFVSIGSIIPVIQSLSNVENNLILNFSFIKNLNLDKYDLFFLTLSIFFSIFVLRTFVSIFLNAVFHSFIKELRLNLNNDFINYVFISSHIEIYDKGATNLTRILDKEIDTITITITDSILKLINNSFLLISLIFLIFLVAPQIIVMIFILFVIGISYYKFYFRDVIKNYSQKRINLVKDKISLSYNIFNAFKEIIIYSKENFFKTTYSNLSKKYFTTEKKFNFFQSNIKPILEFLAVGSLFIYSIYLLKFTSLQISEIIIQFAIIAATSFRILPSISLLTNCFMSLKYNNPIIKLVHSEIKNFENLKKRKKFIINFKDKIILKNINFSYKEKKIFNNFNLEIKKNSIMGIYGLSGAGKTTLVEIVLGITKPDSGEIFIDGVKQQNYLIDASYVSQEIAIVNDTIEKNIALGIDPEEIDKEKLINSVKNAELFKLINGFKDKFKSNLNEMGNNLSGGQKQRISIARAFYKNSNFLIVDEPTSALDENTSKKIIDAFIKNFSTLILISHDKKVLEKCDKLIEIKSI